jgi:putative endonuclease
MARADRPAASGPAGNPGARAEALAADYLCRQGLTLLERNFRTRRGEIDLVMRDGGVIVFVEVRLRTNAAFGGAAASITPTKQARLVAAAQVYLARLGRQPPCRFDAVLLDALAPDRIAWERHILES